MKTNVSIIIPAYNNLDLTKNCVNSIIDKTAYKDYEILIIDNGSDKDFKDFFSNYTKSKKLRYIRNEENLGFSKACNMGAEKAKGNYIIFLNNDTKVIQENWINELIDPIKNEKDVEIVGAKLLYGNDRIQHAGVTFFKGCPFHIYRLKKKNYKYSNKKRYLNAVTAACMSIDKDFFFKLGKFDEGFINGFEDVDLCLRARENNKKILYNPNCVLYHYEGKTPGRKDKNNQNFKRLIRKHERISDYEKFLKEDHKYIKVFLTRLIPKPLVGYLAALLDIGITRAVINKLTR